MNRHAPTRLLAVLLVAAACQDATPVTAPEVEVELGGQVSLLSPEDGLVVRQNDPTIGCPADPHRGYGFVLVLDWADIEDGSSVAGYDLLVRNRGAEYALIDREVEASTYTFLACNGFVIDLNLHGWEWKVRVRHTDGTTGPWSVREFSFEPCRLDDGTPCNAPG